MPRIRVPRLRVLEAFKDPVRRPRAIIWTGSLVLVVAMVMIVALGITSTRWFCAQACHKVQDDTIVAYENSSHSQISCMACHEPVNANTAVFLMAKMKALGELYLTLTDKFELPLNGESELSQNPEEMSSRQCTQCHSSQRELSPSPGIIIDHAAHARNGVSCAVCHNRVAHNEDGIKLTLKGNRKHEDFMKMEGCFRCHDGQGKKRAPGDCTICHTPDFPRQPENHATPGFFDPKGKASGHAELARKDAAYCSMCHDKKTFCDRCHGLPMPHPAGFAKDHGAVGKAQPRTCSQCHARGADAKLGAQFCNQCHHKQSKPGVPWVKQHPLAVQSGGSSQCLECHPPTYCAKCHVRGSVGS